MRVRIVGGGKYPHTKILNVDTGEPLEGVFRVDYSSAIDNTDTAIISLYVSEVDIEVDANIRKFCPYCKREIIEGLEVPEGTQEEVV